MAVTKYAGVEGMRELLDSGLVDQIGENRVQEAEAKRKALGPSAAKARWRLIGHLQSNKARRALDIFDALDSLDSLRLAQALERILSEKERRLPALVQIKLAERRSQSGVSPEALEGFLESLKGCPHLDILGLMAIAPELEPVEETRPYFRRMRELFDRFFSGRPEARLSMGMSRDFEIAVEEGASLVRIGSTIFSGYNNEAAASRSDGTCRPPQRSSA